MKTQLINENEHGAISKCAEILRNGGLVGIPTETVYGLAANIYDREAVSSIFRVKGRPGDNPLIVHISDFDQLSPLVTHIPESAEKLAKAFWPGPLTIILPRSNKIIDEISGNLNTVAVRLPVHATARLLISECGFPLAAPSANISGSPSPTTAQHVVSDLGGKIEAVLDGGTCSVGVESTVITLDKNIKILRPGGITREQIESALGQSIEIDKAVFTPLRDGETASSPGMKYKHYSPGANLIIIKGSTDKYIEYVNSNKDKNIAALCYDGDRKNLLVPSVAYGEKGNYTVLARQLFDALREIDKTLKADTVYVRCPSPEGMGLAVYNRLLRAAGFEIVEL